MSISNLKKKFIDFVPTISDSEEDIPDYDEESSEDEESELLKQKEESLDDKENSKKSKKNKKINQKKIEKKLKKQQKQNKNKNDEEDGEGEEDLKELNPSFTFALDEDNYITNTSAQDWDFGSSGKHDLDSKKDVDLDSIIRRKGGLGVNIADLNGEEEEEDEDDDDEDEDDDDEANEDDDELAMDGFGMGAPAEEEKKDEDDEDDEEDDDEDDDEEQDEENAEEDDEDTESEVKDDEDTAEEIANFYAPDDEGEEFKSVIHKDFQSLALSRPVLKGLSALGYSKPSPIQSASIPVALMGKDIVAGAVTGSGKTAAYMIPIIERLLYKPSKIAATRVLILAPTRELALQVADVGRKIGRFVNGLTFGLAVGGMNVRQQEQELKNRPDIVVGTPGRLIDHIRNSPSFNIDNIEVLVFDEADRMLEEGFQEEMTEILSYLPISKRQTMLFSATMNSKIKSLIQLSLKRPVRIMIDTAKSAATGLVQQFVRIRKRESSKPALLFNILSQLNGVSSNTNNQSNLKQMQSRIIIFVARKEMAHKLRIILGLLGLKVSELHGSLTQEQRSKNITDFKKLVVPILVCTDLAARGLDIPKIETVINFDMPKTYEIYLHRVGRTARAGREGTSISFVGESTQDRNIVKEAIKSVETNKKSTTNSQNKITKSKVVGRNVDWNEVEKINKVLQTKEETIEEVLVEEKQEKELLRAEMDIKKGENILRYQDEIKSRPRRTWFQSEKEKNSSKLIQALGSNKKINSKKRKAIEAKEDSPRIYKKTKNDRIADQERKYNKQTGKAGKGKGKGKFKSKK
ncbi:nucleotide binding protein [[Candida] boidinii]|nr:nucleotide binding protein [[Candida] boidinii]